MIKKVNNPFKKEWETLDIEGFKEDIMDAIDDIVDSCDEEEMDMAADEIYENIVYLITLAYYKDMDEIEVICMKDIPKEKLMQVGYTKEEIDAFDESQYIPLKQAQELFDFKAKGTKPNKWKI